ncbi:MAG: glycosyltransferase family 39 protein [Clostridiales Family XIII bacterium]|nr:glycosyltransferase family 39 protein [Clostridiales Family XIII bacterium]
MNKLIGVYVDRIFCRRNAFFIVVFIILFKIFFSASIELHSDEAYYWLWSKNLALGYFDHSPMVAWFIKITTLFSNCELAVRFSSIIITIVISVLIWKLTKKLFNETIAAASVITLNTLPEMMMGSIIITPDTPVFLFFSLAIYYLYYLIETNKTKYWYITGLFFGLSLLSKYTAVLFGLSLFVYIIADRKWPWFRNKHFYFMFCLSFILFLPVIIWNSQHDWVSFTFQLHHGLAGKTIHLSYIFEYLGSQCLMAGPLIFIVGMLASVIYFCSKNSKKVFISTFTLSIITFFMFTAFKTPPEANWPALAYFAFSIVVCAYLLENNSKVKRKILIYGVTFNFFISFILGLHVKYSIVPIWAFSRHAAIIDPTNEFYVWRLIGDNLLKRDIKYVIMASHQTAGAVAYYTRGKVNVLNGPKPGNQFKCWSIPDDLDYSKTAIVNEIDIDIEDDFNETDVIEVLRKGTPIRRYTVVESNGYKMEK